MNQFLDIFARPKTKKVGAEAALEVPTGEKASYKNSEKSWNWLSPGVVLSVWPCLHFRDYWIGYVLGWCLFV